MLRFMWRRALEWSCATAFCMACQGARESGMSQGSPAANAGAVGPLAAVAPPALQGFGAGLSTVSSAEVLASAAPASVGNVPVQVDLVEPYPPGHWRLADPARLDNVMLWFRQILIRHRDCPSGLVSHNLPHWRGAPAPPDRSREEAFALAQSIAEEARLHPDQFGALAEARSEDVATRRLGGVVGGLQASAIRVSVVLDVMAALRPAEVSRVVETGYGFHVFQRLAPPSERRVSGSRIVITHDDAPWVSHFLARWPIARRSASRARALADEIYQQLQADPARFDELVQQYSDHHDAVRGGDFGQWSTRERTAFPRELEVLQRLKPGEVAAPMDSLFGIQIIKRTAERERTAFSYTALRLHFDPEAAVGSERSEASVAARARAIADDVFAFPLAFAEYQRQLGGGGRSELVQGRSDGPVERVLEQLTPGQVARSPIRLRNDYLLLQRLTPSSSSPPATPEWELPAPEHADLRTSVASYGLRLLAQSGPVLAQSSIDWARRDRARALLDALPNARGASAEQQLVVLEGQLQTLLGADTADYVNGLRAGVEASLLASPRHWRMVVPSAPAGFFASSAPGRP
jgi:hypothetical protein